MVYLQWLKFYSATKFVRYVATAVACEGVLGGICSTVDPCYNAGSLFQNATSLAREGTYVNRHCQAIKLPRMTNLSLE